MANDKATNTSLLWPGLDLGINHILGPHMMQIKIYAAILYPKNVTMCSIDDFLQHVWSSFLQFFEENADKCITEYVIQSFFMETATHKWQFLTICLLKASKKSFLKYEIVFFYSSTSVPK